VVAFPILVVLAFYSSLNVIATNGPLFSSFGNLGGLYYTVTNNASQITTVFLNQSSVQNESFPSFLPAISIASGYLIAIIVILLVAVSLSVILNFRRQSAAIDYSFESEAELEKKRNEVADILDRAVLELRQGSEYRQTVIECYKRISEILASRTNIDGAPLTTREFEVSVSARLRLNTPYLAQMTDVFELARYSSHQISKAEADTAMECLSKLSSLLRGEENSTDNKQG
jgi:hypothetical protein